MVTPLASPIVLELLFYVAALVFSIHISMISYHWYQYVDRKTLAHQVVFSYLLIGLICLGALAIAVFIS